VLLVLWGGLTREPYKSSHPIGAVSSQMPCSCGALRRQAEHGCVQECGLFGDEVGASGDRTTPTGRRQSACRSSPYEQTTIKPPPSGRESWQCAHGERRHDAGPAATMRLRGTAGRASVQHGRGITDASDKDAGTWARPPRATGCRPLLRVGRGVVGVVVCKRQMGSKRESSAPLGRSVLTPAYGPNVATAIAANWSVPIYVGDARAA
jgi:hypothetical protein